MSMYDSFKFDFSPQAVILEGPVFCEVLPR